MTIRCLLASLSIALIALGSGCLYPPQSHHSEVNDQITLPVPYDLGWDAVNEVLESNKYWIQVQDPAHGIIEAQSHHFALQDADCGITGTAVGKVVAEPNADATAVYNFTVTAAGSEATTVGIQATFSTPVQVPFHPVQDMTCISRGVQEQRLLKEVREAASRQHRPVFKQPIAN